MSDHYESASDFIARLEADADSVAADFATDELTLAADEDAAFFAEQAALDELDAIGPLIGSFQEQRGHSLTHRELGGIALSLSEQNARGDTPDAERAYEQFLRDSGDKAPDFSTTSGRVDYAVERMRDMSPAEPIPEPVRPDTSDAWALAQYGSDLMAYQQQQQNED